MLVTALSGPRLSLEHAVVAEEIAVVVVPGAPAMLEETAAVSLAPDGSKTLTVA